MSTDRDGCTHCNNLGLTKNQGRVEYCSCSNGYAARRLRVKLKMPRREPEPVGLRKVPGGLAWRGERRE